MTHKRHFSSKKVTCGTKNVADAAVRDARCTWPYVVSSRSAIGPRAWSFWVLMPISAPKPNWAPSVNAVETLTYTHAASTLFM